MQHFGNHRVAERQIEKALHRRLERQGRIGGAEQEAVLEVGVIPESLCPESLTSNIVDFVTNS